MPRVIVTTEHVRVARAEPAILLDEHVHPVHLSSGHAAAQLVERIAWAISDAEEAERAPATSPAPRRAARAAESARARRSRAGRRRERLSDAHASQPAGTRRRHARHVGEPRATSTA